VFIELVELLRCVREHEPTWLVATCDRMEGRRIVEGMLGCPACQTRYPITDGVADFTLGVEEPRTVAAPEASEGGALALAAWLNLAEPGGLAVLTGSWASAAHELAELANVHVLALDAPPNIGGSAAVSVARVGASLPLREGVARGIALDETHASTRYVESAARALTSGGRLLAAVAAPFAGDLVEVARDQRRWLAMRSAAPAPVVPLRRARPL